MCGKYVFSALSMLAVVGSPPRVREIQISTTLTRTCTRITPACAGNTYSYFILLCFDKDHPRVCGKYFDKVHIWFSDKGSPPRVREIQCKKFGIKFVRRITPACAGNTVWRLRDKIKVQDHPRVCGKYGLQHKHICQHPGSPPRVREIRDYPCTRKGLYRITPACAGNTGLAIIKSGFL